MRIPVIASLNGHTGESWLKFAHIIEQAGADALEFNYYGVAPALTVSSAALEEQLISAVRSLTQAISIPMAVKLTPFYTAFGHVAAALDRAGASGLVLFNRFYQPDVNTRTMTLVPQAELSTSAELPLRLHWLALLAGADVVQLVSALLRHGPGHIGAMQDALERWLEWQHLDSLTGMIGRASFEASPDPNAIEPAHYIRTLQNWTR